MNILLLPFRLVYKIYFALFFATTFVLFYPIFKYFLVKKERFPTAMKWMKFYAKLWLICSGIFLKIKGRENIPVDQPFVICANHSSFLDIPCLYSIFPQYFVFTGKKEIEKWPLFHIFYTSGMNILVDRHNKREALKAYKKMLAVIDDGYPLVILPEGTISKTAPKLAEFKSGAVSLAVQKQIPILPITFTTNWKRLERKGFFFGKASPGIAEAIVHPVIDTKGLTKDDHEMLQMRLREVIDTPLRK